MDREALGGTEMREGLMSSKTIVPPPRIFSPSKK